MKTQTCALLGASSKCHGRIQDIELHIAFTLQTVPFMPNSLLLLALLAFSLIISEWARLLPEDWS